MTINERGLTSAPIRASPGSAPRGLTINSRGRDENPSPHASASPTRVDSQTSPIDSQTAGRPHSRLEWGGQRPVTLPGGYALFGQGGQERAGGVPDNGQTSPSHGQTLGLQGALERARQVPVPPVVSEALYAPTAGRHAPVQPYQPTHAAGALERGGHA